MAIHQDKVKLLHNILLEYLIKKDIQQLSKNIETLVQPYGGLLEKFTTNYLFITPNDNFILVFMPAHTMNQAFIRMITKEIVQLCNDCKCCAFSESQNQMMEKGVYLSIFSPEISVMSIYSRLEKFRNKLSYKIIQQGVNLSYPYQSCFYQGVYFGGIKLFKQLIPLFSRLSSISLWIYEENIDEKKQKNLRLIITLKAIYYFTKANIHEKRNKNIFLTECFYTLLPDIVDINGLYNINQLSNIQTKILEVFNNLYSKEKGSLKEIILKEIGGYSAIEKELKNIFYAMPQLIKGHTLSFFTNIGFYTKPENALAFHILNHILSIFHLNSKEKFALIQKLQNLSKDYDIW